MRQTWRGKIQRYICRDCGYRFSETTWNGSDKPESVQKIDTKILCSPSALPYNRQICATQPKGAKNLAEVESRTEKWAAGATKTSEAEAKGKIVEFAWWMKKQGYTSETIRMRAQMLKSLVMLGADLMNPESVKEALAKNEKWSLGTKNNAVIAYNSFLEMLQLLWEPPRYRRAEAFPFIPLESELDALINASGRKLGTFLQGLKDTGADPGELAKLEWIDINFMAKTVTLKPVKGHNPRVVPVSDNFLTRLNNLKKDNSRIFGLRSLACSFYHQRQRTANTLGNPRLAKITFRTFRHWKGTMEYHKTKDPYHVKRLLGHKTLRSTEVYINLEQALFTAENNAFHVKVAENPQEIKALLEVGFEYICEKDGLMFFRKRK